MEVIFMRVGIDRKTAKKAGIVRKEEQSAPCNSLNGDFVYVPVPVRGEPEDSSLAQYYAEDITVALERFGERNHHTVSLPLALQDKSAHLDPDFCCCRLSYGNSNDNDERAIAMSELAPGDFMIFYNGMRDITKKSGELVYGIIGRLKVQAVKKVEAITDEAEIERNIHTRRTCRVPTDVVVFGEQSAKSGRLKKYLPIGQRGPDNNHYYLKDSLVNQWGGICGKSEGELQTILRAKWAVNIKLCDPIKFLDWWDENATELIHKNNP